MRLSENQVKILQGALEVAKLMEIETAVISEGMIRGAKSTSDTAIISELDLGLPSELTIALADINKLYSRIGAFTSPTIEISTNDNNEATTLTIREARAKMEYRCAPLRIIAYPKANNDEHAASVTLTADELKLLVKSVNTIGSEYVVFQISRNGQVTISSMDVVRDQFEMVLSQNASFVDDAESQVVTHLAKHITKAFGNTATGNNSATAFLGASGSIAVAVKGHNVVIIPRVPEDEEDFDDE